MGVSLYPVGGQQGELDRLVRPRGLDFAKGQKVPDDCIKNVLVTWWLGVTRHVTLTRVLATLFADLGYLVPLLEGARFDTRRHMKGTWRRTRSCAILIQKHYSKIGQWPGELTYLVGIHSMGLLNTWQIGVLLD